MKRTIMKKIREIIRLAVKTDLSLRKIARATQTSRPVVGTYVKSFNNSGLTYEETQKLGDDNLLEILQDKTNTRSDRYAQLSSKFEYYVQELKKPHVTVQKLWEEYIAENPSGFMRSQFFHYFKTWRNSCKLTMHIEHKAGERMFVDFTGKKLHITDKTTGKKKAVETFVAILPASHYTFVYVTENQKTCNWIKDSEQALCHFGGTTKIIVPDSYKSAVSKACRYEPDINPEYGRFAEHYHTTIIPARPLHPDDKALVENAIRIVYHWIYASLRNEVFYSIPELNSAILRELEKYNTKKMQIPGISRQELFHKTEKNALGDLPLCLHEAKSSSKATIQSNYHVLLSEDKHYYSVPYPFYSKSREQGKKIKAEILYTHETVEIYFKNERIAVHKRDKTRNGYTTNPLHMPESHRAYLEKWNPEKIISLAVLKGPDVALIVRKIMNNHRHPEQAYNTCRGIIFLSKTYGNERLNKACKKALYFKNCTYKAVREILVHNREDFEEEPDLFNTLPEHSNIRGAEYYSNKIREEIVQ